MLWEQNKGYYFLSCCTDVGNKVLDLCQRNIERNLLELDTTGNILVRELNWAKPCCTSSKQSSSCYYSISLTVFPFHILCLHLSVSFIMNVNKYSTLYPCFIASLLCYQVENILGVKKTGKSCRIQHLF